VKGSSSATLPFIPQRSERTKGLDEPGPGPRSRIWPAGLRVSHRTAYLRMNLSALPMVAESLLDLLRFTRGHFPICIASSRNFTCPVTLLSSNLHCKARTRDH
jgi:hypothetical protein